MTIVSGLPYPITVKYVIQVGLYPSSDPGFGIELQRSVGSTSNFGQIALISPETGSGFVRYSDVLPHTTATYYYRARHTKPGYTDGAFTGIVASTVGRLAQFQPGNEPFVSLTAAGFGQDIYLTPGNTIKVGTQSISTASTGAYITKEMRLNPNLFQASFTTAKVQYFQTGAGPNDHNALQLICPVDIPVGVTIQSVGAQFNRPSTKQLTRVRLYVNRDQASSGAVTQKLWDKTSTATGYHSVTSSSILRTVGSTETYVFLVDLQSTAVTPSDTVIQWANVTYRMPSYDKTR